MTSAPTRLSPKLLFPLRTDRQKDRLARHLKGYICLFAVAWASAALFNRVWQMQLVSAVNLVLYGYFWYCVHRGNLSIPRASLAVLLVVSTTYCAALGGGTSEIGIGGYGIAILTAGFFMGASGTVLTLLLSIAGFYLVYALERSGTVEPYAILSESQNLINFPIVYGTIAALTLFFFRFMRSNVEEAQASERKFRLLAENVTDVIWTADLNMRLTYVTPSSVALNGFTPEEEMARSHSERFTPESANVAIKTLLSQMDMEYAKSGDPNRSIILELQFKHKDGGAVWGECTARFLRDEHGRPTSIVGVARSIEARKAAEHRERQLAVAAAHAQKLDSLGALAGGIAHDFNNLVMAIQANIEIARLKLPDDSPARDRLNAAFQACADAGNLSTRLLTFSKANEPMKQVVDVGSLLQSSVQLVTSGTNVLADFRIASNLSRADLDAGQIKQVFHNLAINAIQAMPNGGTLVVTAENETIEADSDTGLASGNYVHVQFQDGGVGIAPENLRRIFDPFFTTKATGSGLGLSTSFAIVSQHEGTLTADSQQGVGTTFHVYLPATARPVRPDAANNPVLERGSGKVLAMDDDPAIRRLTASYLNLLGYDAEVASSCDEVVTLFETARKDGNPYDVVILDLTIRGGPGGEEALIRLRKLDPNLKAIAASGHSDKPVIANFADYGFSHALAKPYTLDELSRAIQQTMG